MSLGYVPTKSEYIAKRDQYFEGLDEKERERFLWLYRSLRFDEIDVMDLDLLFEILKGQYPEGRRGAKAQRQFQLFLSHYARLASGDNVGLTKWVGRVKVDAHLKALIGLDPEDSVPSVGSHYNFIDRFFPGYREPGHIMEAKKNKLPKKPPEGQKAEDPRKTPKCEELVGIIGAGGEVGDPDMAFVNTVLFKVGVLASAEAGLVDTDSLDVSGDGTCIPVSANRYGKNAGGGLRSYADPEANCGWDSSKHSYYYGYSGYVMSAKSNPASPEDPRRMDLPCFFSLFPASEHDSKAFLKTFGQARGIWDGEVTVDKVLLDSAHDNMPTYRLLMDFGIEPFIDINAKNPEPAPERGKTFTKEGTPVCAAGKEMAHAGYSQARKDNKWVCPDRGCPDHGDCCADPKTHASYTRPSRNPRYFTKTPRAGEAFKETYKYRTCSERVNKKILADRHVERQRHRGKKRNAFIFLLASLGVHMQARLRSLGLENGPGMVGMAA